MSERLKEYGMAKLALGRFWFCCVQKFLSPLAHSLSLQAQSVPSGYERVRAVQWCLPDRGTASSAR